jgi:hypothetical protein
MANVDTLEQMAAAAQYEREGVSRAVALLKRYAPWFEHQADNLERHVTASLTTTVTEVTDSAANFYAIVIISPAAAGADAFVQMFNVDDTGVTLGTTAPDLVFKCPAGETAVFLHVPGHDSDNLFDAGMSIAATTTHDGNTALAAASLPTVWILYAA